jgi:hypothetical protein
MIDRDEVIQMARENKFGYLYKGQFSVWEEDLLNFANTIAEYSVRREREINAGICDRFQERQMCPAECAGAIRARGEGE